MKRILYFLPIALAVLAARSCGGASKPAAPPSLTINSLAFPNIAVPAQAAATASQPSPGNAADSQHLPALASDNAAEFVLRKFGREAAKDGASALARRIESAALAHGDDVIKAVRAVGPRSLHLIEEAGAHSKQVARLLATHGEHGAVYVATRPKALQLVLRHGDEAAAALVKSRGVALPSIESLGKPAARAFKAVGSPRNARRLAMMAADGGELAKIGRTPGLLAVIEKYGDKALEVVWKHKGALAVTATLAAFLAQPEPFINGAKEITQTVVKPIADVPAIAVKEGAAEVARNTNWTLVFLAMIAALALLAAARFRLPGRFRSMPAKDT